MSSERATWAFDLHWSNDEPLYRAVLDYSRELLRRVPTMTQQTLGRNVRDTVQRWCADESAMRTTGWQATPYVVDRRVLRMMREEVERSGGFADVDENSVGESVLDSLNIET